MISLKKITELLILELDRHFHNHKVFNVVFKYIKVRCIALILLTVLMFRVEFMIVLSLNPLKFLMLILFKNLI